MLDGNFKRGDLVQIDREDATDNVYRIRKRVMFQDLPEGEWVQLEMVVDPLMTIYQRLDYLKPADPIKVLDALYEVGVSP